MPTTTTSATDRVPLATKLLYGAAGALDIWSFGVPLAVANQVFTMQLHVPVSVVSTIFLIWVLWDAFTGPLMGWITDNTRTRWGRRRPWLLVGAIAGGVTFPLCWCFPESLAHQTVALHLGGMSLSINAAALWFLGFGMLFVVAFTMWNMPYQSMLLEMTPDYHERTRVTAYRAVFQILAAIISSSVWWFAQLPVFANPETQAADTVMGVQKVSILLGAVMVVLGAMPAFLIRERYYEASVATRQGKVPLVRSIAETLQCRPFFLILLVTILMMLGTNVVGSFGTYLATFYVLDGNEAEAAWYAMMSGSAVGSGLIYSGFHLLLIGGFTWLAGRIGKVRCLGIGLFCLLLQNVLNLFLYDPRAPWLMLANALLLSPGSAAVWLMIPSMMADAIDADELRTGERREGSFSSVLSWAVKISMSIGLGLTGYLLEATGFVAERGINQAEGVFRNMRLTMSLLPGSILAVAVLLLAFYPITAARAAEIRRLLEARRGQV